MTSILRQCWQAREQLPGLRTNLGWLRTAASRYHWTYRDHLRRWQRAFEYGWKGASISTTTAQSIAYDMEAPAGWFPLVTITTDDVLESAREQFKDDPRLERLCMDAAGYVANKWNSSGDELYAAMDWAIEKVKEYAEREGIVLVELDGEPHCTCDIGGSAGCPAHDEAAI